MSFISSHKARVMLGQYAFDTKLESIQIPRTYEMLDSTTLNDTAHRFTPGVSSAGASMHGYIDSDTVAIAHTYLNTLEATGLTGQLTYGPNGFAIGQPVHLVDGWKMSLEAGSPVNGLSAFDLNIQPSGVIGYGVSLHDLGAETGDGNHTSVNGGAASTTGAIAHIHVTAFSGLTDNVVTIEDSADDAAFATIGTFSTITGVTSQRLTITGTVRQYVRAVTNVTGVGSCTFMVGFART